MTGGAIPLSDDDIAAMGLIEEPGLVGWFTRAQAPGAIANGTRLVKCASEPGDITPVGTHGEVVGSVGPFQHDGQEMLAYFVRWDDKPNVVVFAIGWKVAAAH